MKQLYSYRHICAVIFFFLISGTLSSQTVLTCADIQGTGDLNTRCVISNKTVFLSDGDIISGTGVLELQNHGELHLTAGNAFTIDMGEDVIIQNGGRIYGNVEITCVNLYVDGGVNATARGNASSEGPGAGEDGIDSTHGGAGAAYGGHGGIGQNTVGTGGSAYEFTLTQPTQMGSGGGEQQFWFPAVGGKGGGAVKVIASGMVTVNGTIGTNGDVGFCMGPNYCSGGGSGGSIWIQANSLQGTGSITANGGRGGIGTFAGGGGGGGRIALYYSNNTFIGSITAVGGQGVNSEHGGAGTVYQHNGTTSSLSIENKMVNGAFTPIDFSVSSTFNNFSVDDSAYVTLAGVASAVIDNFSVGSSGYITSLANPAWLNLSVDNFTISSGGIVDYTGKGYGSAAGISAGTSVTSTTEGAGGGGHAVAGGQGENNGGAGGAGGYGSEYQPTNYGSGGGNVDLIETVLGGNGGGAIWLNVSQNLIIDGTIRADGKDGTSANGNGAGGGAGGSIVLCAETISGSGSISAAGGNGGDDVYDGGGGSGGRLAFYAQTNAFAGITSVMGGSGNSAGTGGNGSFIQETDCGTPPILIDIDEPIVKSDDFRVYPNPNAGSFNVAMYLAEKKDVTLRLVNLVGQELYSEELSQIEGAKVTLLSLEHVPNGIYYLSVITDKVVFTEKIVVQK